MHHDSDKIKFKLILMGATGIDKTSLIVLYPNFSLIKIKKK